MEKESYARLDSIEDKHWWFRARREILKSIMPEYVKLDNKINILDAGCSIGKTSKVFSNKVSICGVDNSFDALEFNLKNNQGINLVNASVNKMPFVDGSFETVIALDLVEHLKDEKDFLKESYRVLRKNGFLIVTVPAFLFLKSKLDDAAFHYRRYTKKDLQNLMKDFKFQTIKISYFNFFLFPIVVLIRLLLKLFKCNENSFFELKIPWSPINTLFYKFFSLERYFLRNINFPFGSSLIFIGKKN